MKTAVLIIFLAAYLAIVLKRDKSLFSVYGAVLLLLALGAISLPDLPGFVNYNVLGIFLGTSILSHLFSFSGVPAHLVEKIEERGYPVGIVYLLVCIITGLVSAFVENVATIMIMAPVGLAYTRKYHLNPVPLLIGMAVSSNLQGCATMVGDSPSIILAMESGMNFNDFFYMPGAKLGLPGGRPGLFFFAQLGALLSFPVLYVFFRKEKKVYKLEKEAFPVRSWVPTWLLGAMIVSLAVSSFFQNYFTFFPLVICLFFGLAGMTWLKLSHNEKIPKEHIDWESFFLLLGIFLLVGSIKKAGFIDSLAGFLAGAGTRSPFLLYLIIVWMSVMVSAFVDNIPYTLAMVSCVKTLTASIQVNPYIFLFGLLLGTCVGGNITPIGASCNVVGVGILKKRGYKVGFLDFVKIGLPFTLAAVAGSSLLMWLVYAR